MEPCEVPPGNADGDGLALHIRWHLDVLRAEEAKSVSVVLFIAINLDRGKSVTTDAMSRVEAPPTIMSTWPATSAWRALPSPSNPVTSTVVMPYFL